MKAICSSDQVGGTKITQRDNSGIATQPAGAEKIASFHMPLGQQDTKYFNTHERLVCSVRCVQGSLPEYCCGSNPQQWRTVSGCGGGDRKSLTSLDLTGVLIVERIATQVHAITRSQRAVPHHWLSLLPLHLPLLPKLHTWSYTPVLT